VRNKSSFSCIDTPWRRRGAYKGPPKCDRCDRKMSLRSSPERLWPLLWPGPEQLWLVLRSGVEACQLHCSTRSTIRSCSGRCSGLARNSSGGTPEQGWKPGSFTAPPRVQPGAAPVPAPAAAERHRDKAQWTFRLDKRWEKYRKKIILNKFIMSPS
jgi:hypothetical protein